MEDILSGNVSLGFALIDVENMEIPAINGMRKIIERSPNLIMMVEGGGSSRNPRRNEEQTRDQLNYLEGKGYEVYKYKEGNLKICELGKFVK